MHQFKLEENALTLVFYTQVYVEFNFRQCFFFFLTFAALVLSADFLFCFSCKSNSARFYKKKARDNCIL